MCICEKGFVGIVGIKEMAAVFFHLERKEKGGNQLLKIVTQSKKEAFLFEKKAKWISEKGI